MDTFVVRITPRRIERLVFGLIIIMLIFSTAHYANKYYDTTPEDKGYLDKIFSGTFFAKIPTEAEVVSLENISAEAEIETVETVTVEDEENNTVAQVNETEAQATEEENEECTSADFKVVSFDTETTEENENKAGIVESFTLSYCNIEDDENYMIAEIYLWDEFDKDENLVNNRKSNPYYTTPQIMLLMPWEKYTKRYDLPSPRSIWRDPKFNYMVKYYYVDEDGERINTTAIKSISSSYTIK